MMHTEQMDKDSGLVSDLEQEKDQGWSGPGPSDQAEVNPDKIDQIEREKEKGRSGGSSGSW